MNTFTLLFLVILALSFAVEWWLSRRQLAHVRAHRDAVPDAFKDTISLDAHQKAADYTTDKGRLGNIDRILGLLILLLFTLGGGIDAVNRFWADFELSPLVTGIGVILSTILLINLLELPISIYQTFVIEERYGFNRNTPRQFMTDLVLQTALSLAIGAPLLAVILWIMQSVGSYWWLLAWSIVIGFSILMSWAFPTFIAPLFNKFTPLQDETLKKRIETLLSRCGFSSKGIFVMDGSRRSGHGNAYFTGIGDSKRIVFFDTLINALSHEELEAVLAHELGHFRRRHVLKMLVASALMTLIGFALLGWLSGQDWFYGGLGVSDRSNSLALLLFMLVTPAFTTFLQPVIAYFQRRHEFEADDFAAYYTKPAHLISALVKLYRDNASTLTPDPLYSAFHYSHPPASIRIANLSAKPS
ncbi:M48 family metallopeptidase [Methylocaldum sp. MU1018]